MWITEFTENTESGWDSGFRLLTSEFLGLGAISDRFSLVRAHQARLLGILCPK